MRYSKLQDGGGSGGAGQIDSRGQRRGRRPPQVPIFNFEHAGCREIEKAKILASLLTALAVEFAKSPCLFGAETSCIFGRELVIAGEADGH